MHVFYCHVKCIIPYRFGRTLNKTQSYGNIFLFSPQGGSRKKEKRNVEEKKKKEKNWSREQDVPL